LSRLVTGTIGFVPWGNWILSKFGFVNGNWSASFGTPLEREYILLTVHWCTIQTDERLFINMTIKIEEDTHFPLHSSWLFTALLKLLFSTLHKIGDKI
jgi:hypothetical protein